MTSKQITKIPAPPQNAALTAPLQKFLGLSPISGGVSATGGRYNEMHVDMVRYATKEIVADAKKALPEIEALLERPSPEHHSALVNLFCTSMMMAVNNGPSDAHSMGLKQAAIRMATQHYPVACWNTDVIAAAMSKFQFWPSVAEIVKLLDEHNEPLQTRANQLRRLAELKITAPRGRRKPTAEERAAVEAAVAKLQEERRVREQEENRIRDYGMWMPVSCIGLTGSELADALEREIQQDADADPIKVQITSERIAMLRRNAEFMEKLLH